MSIGNRIVSLRNAKGITRLQLADKLGIPMTTLRNYELGTREPGHKFVLDIAQLFNVTTDYLLGMIDDPRPYKEIFAQNNFLSAAELESIKKYRALDEHGKEMVDIVLEKETNRMSETQKHSAVVYNIASFRISRQAASAGTGVLLGPESFREVLVRRDALPRKAAFGVPVSGNSMEPRYHDGDILIISKEIPETHQVGLAMMGEYGYVKINGDGELISLNKDYAPIPMEDGTEFRGKVIGILDQSAILEEVDDYE